MLREKNFQNFEITLKDNDAKNKKNIFLEKFEYFLELSRRFHEVNCNESFITSNEHKSI